MKHIIVEGMDRVGKNTIIQFICSKTDNYIVRHFGKPEGSTNNEKIEFQKKDFLYEFRLAANIHKGFLSRKHTDFLIWNRSYIGEHVHGFMYRNYDPTWIWDDEKLFGFDKKDIYLILLYADVEFTMKKDDGKSLSTSFIEKQIELARFQDAYDLSIIPNKIKIKVNNGDSYIPESEIQEIVSNFLNLK